jgi:hypothetical protein
VISAVRLATHHEVRFGSRLSVGGEQANGRSRRVSPVARVPAKVPSLNRQRVLSLGRENGPYAPFRSLAEAPLDLGI